MAAVKRHPGTGKLRSACAKMRIRRRKAQREKILFQNIASRDFESKVFINRHVAESVRGIYMQHY